MVARFRWLCSVLSVRSLILSMKIWMMSLVEKYGVVSVVLLSCWPNVLFDLCGIVCGHFLMPFTQFFTALFIGKALIKTASQSAFFVFLFSSKFDRQRTHLIVQIAGIWPLSTLIERAFGSSAKFEAFFLAEINRLRHGLDMRPPSSDVPDAPSSPESTAGILPTERDDFAFRGGLALTKVFNWIVFAFIGFFVWSCINQFAQLRRKEEDDSLIYRMLQLQGKLPADTSKVDDTAGTISTETTKTE
eukprot:GHVT01047790.1.p2 GENE.GHVT01047790.1~~GHVT01047790.1.p2  ORF type:complete len:246 (+),score=25.64 GHVT01047790.1:1465-2202(+)